MPAVHLEPDQQCATVAEPLLWRLGPRQVASAWWCRIRYVEKCYSSSSGRRLMCGGDSISFAEHDFVGEPIACGCCDD